MNLATLSFGTTLEMADPVPFWRGKSLALAFHGHFLRGDTRHRGSDYFVNHQGIRDHVIDPLKNQGANLAIFAHTYAAPCNETNQRLIALLQPEEIILQTTHLSKRIVDSFLAVLKLVKSADATHHFDHVFLLRFDVLYKFPITSPAFKLNPEAVNIAWRSRGKTWHSHRMVSDLFFSFPAKYIDLAMWALDSSGNYANRPICPRCSGNGHFFYKFWMERNESKNACGINFLINNTFSGSDVEWPMTVKPELWLGINRKVEHNFTFCNTSSRSTNVGLNHYTRKHFG